MNTAAIDIIVLTYNQAAYIEQALDGILTQQISVPYRVVIADDMSTDDTLERIKKFERKHNLKFDYLTADKNLGMVANYRRAIHAVEADFCCMLEGDDYWTNTHKLQMQYDYMKANCDCLLCYTDCDIIDHDIPSNSVQGVFRTAHRELNADQPLLENLYQANVTWMLSRDLLQHIVLPDNCTDIPLVFMYEACLHGKLHFMSETTAVYRLHSGSVSSCVTNGHRGGYYRYSRNVFLLQVGYIPKFPQQDETRKIIFSDALRFVYPYACEIGDKEITDIIENYFADRLDLDVVKNMYGKIENLELKLSKLENSRKYRLGSFLLKPLDILKK